MSSSKMSDNRFSCQRELFVTKVTPCDPWTQWSPMDIDSELQNIRNINIHHSYFHWHEAPSAETNVTRMNSRFQNFLNFYSLCNAKSINILSGKKVCVWAAKQKTFKISHNIPINKPKKNFYKSVSNWIILDFVRHNVNVQKKALDSLEYF